MCPLLILLTCPLLTCETLRSQKYGLFAVCNEIVTWCFLVLGSASRYTYYVALDPTSLTHARCRFPWPLSVSPIFMTGRLFQHDWHAVTLRNGVTRWKMKMKSCFDSCMIHMPRWWINISSNTQVNIQPRTSNNKITDFVIPREIE